MCWPPEPRVQSLRTASSPYRDRIFLTCHYIPRGNKAIAPEAWAGCESTEACTASCRQRCRKRPKPKPSKTRKVDIVDAGIEATMLDAGRVVPLASAEGPKAWVICQLCVAKGRGHCWIDAYVETHITDVQDVRRRWANRYTVPHSPEGPCVVH